MYQIKTLNKISKAGLNAFDAAKYTCGDDFASPDAITSAPPPCTRWNWIRTPSPWRAQARV